MVYILEETKMLEASCDTYEDILQLIKEQTTENWVVKEYKWNKVYGATTAYDVSLKLVKL